MVLEKQFRFKVESLGLPASICYSTHLQQCFEPGFSFPLTHHHKDVIMAGCLPGDVVKFAAST